MSKNPAFTRVKIDCSADPYDVRPALDAIQERIAHRMKPGPLVVLMGQLHNRPIHHLVGQALMARLLKSGASIAYGMESPHNSLRSALINHMDMPVDLAKKIADSDHNGSKLLRIFRECVDPDSSIQAQSNVAAWCGKQSVPFHVNDVAKSWFGINIYEPLTNELVKRFPIENTSLVSSEGVALRNRMIQQNVIRHIQDSNVDIYIQQTGNGHLYGLSEFNDEYKDSLVFRFLEAGINVLPVFMEASDFDISVTPASAKAQLKKGLTISGLAEEAFEGYSCGEEEFVQKLSRHSNGEIEIVTPEKLTEDLLESWIEEVTERNTLNNHSQALPALSL